MASIYNSLLPWESFPEGVYYAGDLLKSALESTPMKKSGEKAGVSRRRRQVTQI